MKQGKLIHDYNDKFRPKFNQELFVRHDEDIINAIRDVVMSIQRDSVFTIKVLNFEVIDDYDEIVHILWEYEESALNKKSSSKESSKSTNKKQKRKDNQWEYINLKDSDIKLIRVTYFIQICEKKDGLVSDTIQVYIAIPRVIDKFYYRINGNIFSAIYQIVDASTYNNTNSNSKKQTVTFKVVFAAIRTYRYVGILNNIDGENIKCVYFMTNMFKKTILTMKYLFAKMGYYEALEFLGVRDVNVIRGKDLNLIDPETNYIFRSKDKEIYVTVPKFLFNNSLVTQSAVYTLYTIISFTKDLEFKDIFSNELYIESLGSEFASKNINTLSKGLAIIDSLEMVYDEGTKKDLKLGMEDKENIYTILRWIMYEFNALRAKDNLDISTKKVRYAEHIAQMYADKLARGIFRLSDKAENAKLSDVKRAIITPPMFLLNAMTSSRCQLVTYKGCANDLDALFALKFTYKGVSGIGEKSNAIPASYRQIHPSHLGRVDLDSSSPSDPGVSGTICPLSSIKNSYFKEFTEPSTWRESRARMLDAYRQMNSKLTMCTLIDMVKEPVVTNPSNKVLRDCIDVYDNLVNYIANADEQSEVINGIDLFGDGIMFISMEE